MRKAGGRASPRCSPQSVGPGERAQVAFCIAGPVGTFVLALLSFRAHTRLSPREALVVIGDENAGRAPASSQTEGADARSSSFDTN